jgi:hypothetical protein
LINTIDLKEKEETIKLRRRIERELKFDKNSRPKSQKKVLDD